MIKQYIFVLKNDTFFSQSVGRKQLFWFFEALDCVNVKTKCAVCAVGFKLAENGKGLREVRATANRKWRGEPISSKNHFHFFKFTKKNEMVFCGYFLEYF